MESFQVAETNQPRSYPERNLLVAMVERAVFDFFGSDTKESANAALWLFHEADRRDPFSFGWICEELDIAPVDMLNQIKQMKPRGNMTTHQWWASQRIA